MQCKQQPHYPDGDIGVMATQPGRGLATRGCCGQGWGAKAAGGALVTWKHVVTVGDIFRHLMIKPSPPPAPSHKTPLCMLHVDTHEH